MDPRVILFGYHICPPLRLPIAMYRNFVTDYRIDSQTQGVEVVLDPAEVPPCALNDLPPGWPLRRRHPNMTTPKNAPDEQTRLGPCLDTIYDAPRLPRANETLEYFSASRPIQNSHRD
jgi:hypothetical protein